MANPTTGILLNTQTPPPPTDKQNIRFATDGGQPQQQVTAYDPEFVGDTGTGGKSGNVPAPAVGDANKFLRGDGSWADAAGTVGMMAEIALPDPNGSTTYTLPSTPANPTASWYIVNGLKKKYGLFYTISGNTLTILGTPPNSDGTPDGDTHELFAS